MNPLDAVASALDALRANAMRSALTMLGIVIGVALLVGPRRRRGECGDDREHDHDPGQTRHRRRS